jgi:hypothetical protein
LENNAMHSADHPEEADLSPSGFPEPSAPESTPDPASSGAGIRTPFQWQIFRQRVLRIGVSVVLLSAFVIALWTVGSFYLNASGKAASPADPAAGPAATGMAATPSMVPSIEPPDFLMAGFFPDGGGIPRLAQLHTILPARPRWEVIKYTVVKGDTIFGIAEKFGLYPETILWGNLYVLGDNPHFLQPDQELSILPTNGVYHRWSEGEGLNGVADYYGVSPDDIVDWPGNHLTREAVGDYAAPRIAAGTWLVVPGGKREFSSWATPRITRGDPASARILGPGYCGSIVSGVIGGGTFVWPAPTHWLSGYDYSPATNHRGIDIGGETGDAIYSVDHGVVVYAGWNDWGYGNVVVIDHGNGWQTLYAHLSSWNVGCGASVYQGSVIGLMGSTGRSTGSHLHFELMHDSYGKVNPWDFLP